MERYMTRLQTLKKDTDRGKGFYNWIIAELENKTTFLDNSIDEDEILTTVFRHLKCQNSSDNVGR